MSDSPVSQDYVHVPARAVFDDEISPGACVTFCRLCALAWIAGGDHARVRIHVEDMAKALGVSVRTVWAHLAALRARRHITFRAIGEVIRVRILPTPSALLQDSAVVQETAVHGCMDGGSSLKEDDDPPIHGHGLLQNSAVEEGLAAALAGASPLRIANIRALRDLGVNVGSSRAIAVSGMEHVTPAMIRRAAHDLQGKGGVWNFHGLLLYRIEQAAREAALLGPHPGDEDDPDDADDPDGESFGDDGERGADAGPEVDPSVHQKAGKFLSASQLWELVKDEVDGAMLKDTFFIRVLPTVLVKYDAEGNTFTVWHPDQRSRDILDARLRVILERQLRDHVEDATIVFVCNQRQEREG